MVYRKKLILLLFIICTCIVIAPLAVQGKSSETEDIEILIDQKITMKDGIKLSANVYKPVDMKEPLPAIFAFTPYISDEGQTRGPFFALNGYVYVHVDVRGRGNSEGDFFPLEKDGVDGAQVVEWIAKQPWCSGEVAMRGGSYRGMVQWQVLKHFPPALKTIVPTAAAAPGVDFPMYKNIFGTYSARWLGFTMTRTKNTNLFGDGRYWANKSYIMYSKHLRFSDWAQFSGSNEKIFKRWIAHPFYDDYWKSMSFPDKSYNKITIPILSITGHFDGDQPGAMHYYYNHIRYGTPDARGKHFLIIGPWDHAGTRRPRKKLGGLVFPDNAVMDMEKLHLEWYDWILKGKGKPKFLQKRVCYYVMKENKWKYVDSLEEVSNQTKKWYLSSQAGQASDVFHSGSLDPSPPARKQNPDVFEYDPLKTPVSKQEFSDMQNDPDYLLSQRDAFFEEKLIYHSPPLKEAVEVSGHVRFKIYIQLNVPDTDFGVQLFEIRPDGKTIALASDQMRARYRKSLSRPERVTPGKVELYELDQSFFFSRRLTKGCRLRLIIHSLNVPYFQKNYNSGGVVADETAKDARKAVIKVFHDKRYPSCIELPVKLSD
jgi:putative CocE/NonD family hydrolase